MAKQPAPQPMPLTQSATKVVPTPITALTNESRQGPRIGSMSVNPGKPGDK